MRVINPAVVTHPTNGNVMCLELGTDIIDEDILREFAWVFVKAGDATSARRGRA